MKFGFNLSIVPLFISAIFLLYGATAFAMSPVVDKELKSTEKLIDAKRWEQAVSKLKTLYKTSQSNEKDAGVVAVMLARALNGQGKFKEAAALLEKLNSGRPVDYHLELGETYLSLSNYDKAVIASKNYNEKSGQLIYLKALWLRARAYLELKKYRDCIESCAQVTKHRQAANIEGLADFNAEKINKDTVSALKKQAGELAQKAQELFDIQEYGRDYAWYRKAREAEAEKEYGDAIRFYGNIKKGTLRSAARCYIAKCTAEMGKAKEALKVYEEIYAGSRKDLYYGEALYNAAILTYRDGKAKKDAKDALKLIEQLQEWILEMQRPDMEITLEDINDALKKDIIAVAPKEFLREDDCGNLIRSKSFPGSINNPLTAPWYLPALATKSQLLYGFLLGDTGEKEKAAAAYREAPEAGRRVKIISDNNMISNLLAGLADETYMLPEKLSKKLSLEYRNKINLAYFYYLCREKEQAEEIFQKIVTNKKASKNKYDLEAAELGLCYCLISARKWQAAEEKLEKLRFRSSIAQTAAFLEACVLAPQTGKKGNKAYIIFEEIASDKKSELAPKALLALAISAVNKGNKVRALDACKDLKAKYKKTPYAQAASTLSKAIKEASGKEFIAPVETETGKVVNHSRTIVMPGNANWQAITDGLAPGDLILYKLTLISRDNCSIVSGVSMTLTEEEPQPPSAKGNEIVFVRTPLLYVKELSYNFDEIFKAQSSSKGN